MIATAVGTLAASSIFACGAGDRPPATVVATAAEASAVDEAIPVDAAEPPRGYDAGLGLGLVDVADTPCAARGGSLVTVLAPGSATAPVPAFRSLHALGSRRVADAADGSGFLVFDDDGKNARLVTTELGGGAAVPLGEQILFGGSSDRQLTAVQRYDATGAAVGDAVALSFDEGLGLAAGADDQAALLVWATANAFVARGIADGGAAGDAAYELAVGAKGREPSIAVSSVKSGLFGVAFSGNDGVLSQTAFGRGSTSARIGDPSNLFTGEVARTVAGFARTPSGFALLVTVDDGPNPYAMLVTTDAGGRRTSAGLKLVGTSRASGIAVNGSQIGVLAHRREGTAFASKTAVEFRPFDLAGAPLGPWTCLDVPGDETALGGGIIADGHGYAVISRAADGSAALARFDHLGTGAP